MEGLIPPAIRHTAQSLVASGLAKTKLPDLHPLVREFICSSNKLFATLLVPLTISHPSGHLVLGLEAGTFNSQGKVDAWFFAKQDGPHSGALIGYTEAHSSVPVSSKCFSTITGREPIDVTSDYVFKGIFRDAERMTDFLTHVLIGQDKVLPAGTIIEDIEFIANEHTQHLLEAEAKRTVFDVQVKTNEGIFIVEMQRNYVLPREYLKRVEFYGALALTHQTIKAPRGKAGMKDYRSSLPVIVISFVSDKVKMFDQNVPCVSYHMTLEGTTKKRYMKSFAYVFLELGKLNSDEENDSIDKGLLDWLLLFKTSNIDQHYGNEQVNKAVRYVQYVRDNEYDAYVRDLISEQVLANEMQAAVERAVEDLTAKNQKLEEEKKRAEEEKKRAEDMLEEEKKRAEDDKKVMQETLEKTVKTMLQHGIDCDTIAGVTKLPLDEVKRIKG